MFRNIVMNLSKYIWIDVSIYRCVSIE